MENLIKAGMLSVTVWTKLVKTSLIREHDLYFKKGIAMKIQTGLLENADLRRTV